MVNYGQRVNPKKEALSILLCLYKSLKEKFINMKKNILIYDDDVEILLLCKAILSKYDFVVDTLSICDNILNDINTLNPHIILMDLWIPEIGGEKAIEIIKKNEKLKHIPVLLFSANTNIIKISKNINADGFIEKPFVIKTFIETIQRHLY